MNVLGLTNPAMAALKFFELTTPADRIDRQSFIDVAEVTRDYDPEIDGERFLINSVADVNRLCKMGDFAVIYSGEKVYAVKLILETPFMLYRKKLQ